MPGSLSRALGPVAKRLPRRMRHAVYQRVFDARAPWVTGFRIDGATYGGEHLLGEDKRLSQFWDALPGARSILELGSLEGGHSFALAHRPGTRVTAIEGRPDNVARAVAVQRLLDVPNVAFHEADLETTALDSFGQFDAIFCVGLLYHLPRPWALVDTMRRAAPAVFMWTHYCLEADADAEVDGAPGRWYDEYGHADPLSGLSARSFWPTLPALVDRLKGRGYRDVRVIEDDPGHPHGPSITLVAQA